MPDNYDASNQVTVNYEELAYYPVTFSAGPNGTVAASTGNSYNAGNAIKSGTMVKEGTYVTFKATPNSGYAFSKWTGTPTTTSTNATISVQVTSTNKGVDRKGWFKYNNDGTAISSAYFAYNTNNNYTSWTNSNIHSIYYKDGRAYAYINSPGTTNTYFFTISSATNPSTDTSHGDGKGTWTYNMSDLACVTDFNQYVTAKQANYNYYNPDWTNYMGEAKAKTSNVSRLIIDLGECDGTNVKLDYNTFRVIPVYDTDSTNVDIYAKDGSYRGSDYYDFFPKIADTTITGASNI